MSEAGYKSITCSLKCSDTSVDILHVDFVKFPHVTKLMVLLMFTLQFITVHLNFLQFILQDGALYLPWHRARDIWETLVANTDACFWDREVTEHLFVHEPCSYLRRSIYLNDVFQTMRHNAAEAVFLFFVNLISGITILIETLQLLITFVDCI